MKNVKTRGAIRLGDPHSAESVSRVVERYGAMKIETMNKIVEWLKSKGDLYKWEIGEEFGNPIETKRKISLALKGNKNGFKKHKCSCQTKLLDKYKAELVEKVEKYKTYYNPIGDNINKGRTLACDDILLLIKSK